MRGQEGMSMGLVTISSIGWTELRFRVEAGGETVGLHHVP
jgi:hypothetical protein